jgi:hypothetical protein
VTEKRICFFVRARELAEGRREQVRCFLSSFFLFHTYLVAARGASRVHEPIGMAHLLCLLAVGELESETGWEL